MAELPSPLTPQDCSMQGLPKLPLDIERLQKSKTWLACKRRPELAFYHLNLWMRAFHEEPAASIENHDDVLADAAGCHPRDWDDLRNILLADWVLCSDGRLYHPALSEIVLEIWDKRLEIEKKKAAERARKRELRNQLSAGKKEMSGGQRQMSGGHPTDKGKCPAENALKEKEKEKEKEKKTPTESSQRALLAPEEPKSDMVRDAYKAYCSLCESLGMAVIPRALSTKRKTAIKARLKEHGPETIQLAFDKIRLSPFLRGETGRGGWKGAQIDWLFKAENFQKVIEGNYDEQIDTTKPRTQNGRGNGKGSGSIFDDF